MDNVIINVDFALEGAEDLISNLAKAGKIDIDTAQAFIKSHQDRKNAINQTTVAVQASTKGVAELATANKNLTAAIPIAATKQVAEETVKLTTTVKALSGSYNDLKERMREAEQRFKNTGSKEAEEEYISLRAQVRGTDLEMRNVTKAMANNANSAALLSATVAGTFGAFAAGKEIMSMFYGEDEEGAKKAAKAQQLLVVVMGLSEAARAIHEAGMLKTLVVSKITQMTEALGITTKQRLTVSEVQLTVATEAGVIAKEAEVAATVEGVEATTALYTTKAIETGLTSENTVVKWLAVQAQAALNLVMNANPIVLMITALAGLVVAYEAFTNGAKSAKEIQEQINKVNEADIALRKNQTEALNTDRDLKLKSLDEEIAKKKVSGISEMELLTLELQRAQMSVQYADKSKSINKTDVEAFEKKRQDLEKEIDLKGALIKRNEELSLIQNKKGTLDKAKDLVLFGSSDMGQSNEDRDKANKKAKEELDRAKETLERGKEISEQFKAAKAAEELKKTEIEEKANDIRLRNNKAYFDKVLATTREYEQANLNAKIGDIRAQEAIDLNTETKTEAEKAVIRSTARKAEQDAREAFNVNRLNREKEMLTMQLQYLIGNSEKRRELTFKILEDETKLKIAAAQGNATMIAAIQEAANQQMLKNQIDYEYNVREEKLKTAQMQAGAKVSAAIPGSNGELEAKQAQIVATAALERNESDHSIQNEQQKQARILQIDAEAAQKQKALIQQHGKQELDEQIALLERMQKQHGLDQNEGDPNKSDREKEAAHELSLKQRVQKDQDAINLIDLAEHDGVLNAKEAADERIKYEKDMQDARNDLAQKGAELRKKVEEDTLAFVGETARKLSDNLFENAKQARDNELQMKMDHLNAEKDAELLNTNLTASQRKAINDKYKREEAAAKLAAWKEDQKAKAEQAIINGLLAFTMSMAQQGYPAGLVTGALALATAGVEAGLIMSKTPPKFAKGVVGLQGPGSETSDSIQAYLSKGESVITAKATRQYGPMLEAMNAGSFDKMFPQVRLSDSVGELLKGTGVTAQHHDGSDSVVRKLDEIGAKMENLKQVSVNVNEKGFRTMVSQNGSVKRSENSWNEG